MLTHSLFHTVREVFVSTFDIIFTWIYKNKYYAFFSYGEVISQS